MATPQPVIPVQTTLQFFTGCAWQQKFSPIDPTTGVAKDFTPYEAGTNANMVLSAGTLQSPVALSPVVPTVVKGDYTGLTLSLTAAQVDALLAEVGNNQVNFALTAENAGLSIETVVAVGALSVLLNNSGY